MNDENVNMTPPGAIDELALQNGIRKRYNQNWPATILELMKRIQAVNQTWAKIAQLVMQIPGLRISWFREDGKLIVEVRIGDSVDIDEYERHEITMEQLQEAHQYIEVFIMDKLDHSELIARHSQ